MSNTAVKTRNLVTVNQKTLIALFKNFIAGISVCAIGMSLAYAGDVEKTYDWCDPTYCCNPTKIN